MNDELYPWFRSPHSGRIVVAVENQEFTPEQIEALRYQWGQPNMALDDVIARIRTIKRDTLEQLLGPMLR